MDPIQQWGSEGDKFIVGEDIDFFEQIEAELQREIEESISPEQLTNLQETEDYYKQFESAKASIIVDEIVRSTKEKLLKQRQEFEEFELLFETEQSALKIDKVENSLSPILQQPEIEQSEIIQNSENPDNPEVEIIKLLNSEKVEVEEPEIINNSKPEVEIFKIPNSEDFEVSSSGILNPEKTEVILQNTIKTIGKNLLKIQTKTSLELPLINNSYNFKPYLKSLLKPILSSREWFLNNINDFVTREPEPEEEVEKILVLSGLLGSGRSTLMAQYIENNEELIGSIHFCRYEDPINTTDPGLWLHSMVFQLINNIKGFKIENSEDLTLESCRQNPEKSILIIQNLLNKLPISTSKKVIIIDEIGLSYSHITTSEEMSKDTIADLVIKFASTFPEWIKFIITCRSDHHRFLRESEFKVKLEIEGNQEEVIEIIDIYREIDEEFARRYLILEGDPGENLINTIWLKSKGNMLYLMLILNSIKYNFINTGFQLRSHGQTIEQLLLFLLNKSLITKGFLNILMILVACFEPLDLNQLDILIEHFDSSLLGDENSLSKLLINEIKGKYFINHYVISRFLIGEEATLKYRLHIFEGHEIICKASLREFFVLNDPTPYMLKYLFIHLFISKDTENLIRLVFDFSWLYRKLKECGIYSLRKDIELLSDLQDWDLDSLRSALKNSSFALQLDTSKEQLSQQLLIRLNDDKGTLKLWRLLKELKQEFSEKFWFFPLIPSLSQDALKKSNRSKTYIKLTSTLEVAGFKVSRDSSLISPKPPTTTTMNSSSSRNFIFAAKFRKPWLSSKKRKRKLNLQKRKTKSRIGLNSQWIEAAVIFPDESMAATSWSDHTIAIWDLNLPGTIIRLLEGHRLDVKGIAIVGKKIISVSDDRTLRKWTLSGEKISVTAHDNPAVCVSSNEEYVVTAGLDKIISIWDKYLRKINELIGHSSFIVSLDTFENFIISGSWDKTIKLWNKQKAKLITTLEGHNGWVTTVSFSFNGKYIISGSADNSIRVWNSKKPFNLINEINFDYPIEKVCTGSTNYTSNLLLIAYSSNLILINFLKNQNENEIFSNFIFESQLTSLSWKGRYIVCGDQSGSAHFLHLVPPNNPTLKFRSGYLIKQGGGSGGKTSRKSWKKRWFVLGTQSILYFSSKKKKKKLGRIDLFNSSLKSNIDRKFCFEIHTPKRIWYLQAANRGLMEDWMSDIDLQINFIV